MAKKNVSAQTSGAGFLASLWLTLEAAAKDNGLAAEDFHFLSTEEARLLAKPIGEAIVRIVSEARQKLQNLFALSIGGSRTTEQVVVAGNYGWANSNINSKLFPWRRRQGKRTVELVDMTQHGFPPSYSLDDALAILTKLGLERPVYEDGLLFGEQHPEKQRERPVMFPHEPVVVDGGPSVVYLWSGADVRKLDLSWTGRRWDSGVLVAGVRKL